MQNGFGGSWTVSSRSPYQILMENQCKIALEAPMQFPLDFFTRPISKTNAKRPWRLVGRFLQISSPNPYWTSTETTLENPGQFLFNPHWESMKNCLGGSWAIIKCWLESRNAVEAPGYFPLDFHLEFLLEIHAKWPWRLLGNVVYRYLHQVLIEIENGRGGSWAVSSRFLY